MFELILNRFSNFAKRDSSRVLNCRFFLRKRVGVSVGAVQSIFVYTNVFHYGRIRLLVNGSSFASKIEEVGFLNLSPRRIFVV